MRRPTRGCDKQSPTTVLDTTAACKEQSGPFSCMRRLFKTGSISRRSASLGSQQGSKPACLSNHESLSSSSHLREKDIASRNLRDSSPRLRDSSPRLRDSSPRLRDSGVGSYSPRRKDSSSRRRPSSLQARGTSSQSQDSALQSQDSVPQSLDSTCQSLDSTCESLDSTFQTLDSTFQTLDSTCESLDSTLQSQDSAPQSLDSSPQSHGASSHSQDSYPQYQDSSPLSRDSSSQSRDSSPPSHDCSPTRGGSSFLCRAPASRKLPKLKLRDSLAVIQHEMLGIPLEQVVKSGDGPHGVPLLVRQLCDFMVENEVSSAALVYEDWCSSEVRATVSQQQHRSGGSTIEAGAVAPLLRLYVEQLPQPLLPSQTVTALLALTELGELSPPVAGEGSVWRARRLLMRELPPHNLRLLRYLAAFLVHLQDTNKCDRGMAWVLLAVSMVGAGERLSLGKPLAQYLLQNCRTMFPEDSSVFPSVVGPASFTTAGGGSELRESGDEAANSSSDTSNPAVTSQGEDGDEDTSSEDVPDHLLHRVPSSHVNRHHHHHHRRHAGNDVAANTPDNDNQPHQQVHSRGSSLHDDEEHRHASTSSLQLDQLQEKDDNDVEDVEEDESSSSNTTSSSRSNTTTTTTTSEDADHLRSPELPSPTRVPGEHHLRSPELPSPTRVRGESRGAAGSSHRRQQYMLLSEDLGVDAPPGGECILTPEDVIVSPELHCREQQPIVAAAAAAADYCVDRAVSECSELVRKVRRAVSGVSDDVSVAGGAGSTGGIGADVNGGHPSPVVGVVPSTELEKRERVAPSIGIDYIPQHSKHFGVISSADLPLIKKHHHHHHHHPVKREEDGEALPSESSSATNLSKGDEEEGDYCSFDLIESAKEDDGTDASSPRSTNSGGDLATLPLPFSQRERKCDPSQLWDTETTADQLQQPRDQLDSSPLTGVEESDGGTSCLLSDPWDDFTSAGEVYLGGVSSEDAPIQDEGDPGLGELHLGEARRWSERIYPSRGGNSADHPSPQHRSKRKKSKHRRPAKEGGAVRGSTPDEGVAEDDKLSSLSRTHSEEHDEGVEDDADVTITAANVGSSNRQDSLSSLLDYNEPAVACDRGRWNVEHHDDHRTALRYSRYEDEGRTAETDSTWYKKYDRPTISVASTDHHTPYDLVQTAVSSSSCSAAFMKAVSSKGSSSAHRNISSIKKRIKRFEEEFENKFGYKPSHSEKMKHKEIKKYMSDLSKARKELKMVKEGVADLVYSKGFSLSLLRCQESTQNHQSPTTPLEPASPQLPPDSKSTLHEVEDRLHESRGLDGRPQELGLMSSSQMGDEKTALQKALLYYESLHGRPNTREARELARPLYDRYRQVKRNVSRAQSRAKENINELAPIMEHVAMDFTLASPQHRSSLIPDTQPVEQLLQCKERLLAVQHKQQQLQLQQQQQLQQYQSTPPVFIRQDSDDVDDEDEEEEREKEGGGSLSDSSDVSRQSSTALSNLHSLPLHELRERRREAKDHKKKLRRSLRQFEERYEREHGHKLAKEDRGVMEQTYLDYKHAKAKLRLLEALISKKAPKDEEF